MGQKATHDVEPDAPAKKKLDLSATQVAGSSLATVAAALLASKMGVYGTILGAGVVSVVATAGGPVIQHLFRRTGDQLRESARPKARRVPAPREERAPDGTMPLRAVAPPDEEFGEATVHGTRVRGWKRTAVAAGAAFVISLGALGTYEAVSDTSVSSGGTIFSGGTRKVSEEKPAPSGNDSRTGEKSGNGKRKQEEGEKGGTTPDSGATPTPSGSTGGGGPGPSPDPSGSKSADPTPSSTPSKQTPTPTPPSTHTPSGDTSPPADG
ncbi:hypothetical protein [Streptomyces sp. NPDC059874]|uniref:hypothetical protein n=1 Tax=Streptomyces sp. NPDC059874 TaxID=3346983 RepID=UPI00365BA5EA